MKNFKLLITSGCSFSDIGNGYTWPRQLESSYDIESIHLGLASQGNGLIARKALYKVHECLELGVKPEDILVGIMWSGPDRHDMYFSEIQTQLDQHIKDADNMLENPTSYAKNDTGSWLIMNHHWQEERCKKYYANFHDFAHQRILTYEKILWVQDRLTTLGINYFMTAFTDEVFLYDKINHNSNIEWMKKLVDWSKWLPVSSMHKWCYNYWDDTAFDTFRAQVKETGEWIDWIDNHPKKEMHKRFTKEIILPHIKSSFNDYFCPEFKEYIP